MEFNVYRLLPEEVLKKYETTKNGLSKAEAEDRLKVYGQNKLKMKKGKSILVKIFSQFTNLLVVMMITAGCISTFLGEYRDAMVMFAIVLLNAAVGFVQEFKAERVIESLSKMVQAKAKVIRGGTLEEINAENLVPGDIVRLDEGDAVPADVRLIEENNFAANDFSLTGESNPVKKFICKINGEVALGDRNNLAFMGTTSAIGNAVGVVVNTGMQTEIGRIAHLSEETVDELSPLQKEINDVAKKLTVVACAVAFLLFLEGFLRGHSMREALVFSIAIAASCVPEGTPTQIMTGLSLSAARLAKKKAIIKKLSAVETLGSTHIICTDKTGTLTKNEMTVQKFLAGKDMFSVLGVGYKPEGNILDEKGKVLEKERIKSLELFFETGVLASTARIKEPDAGHEVWYAIGDPTEAALISLAAKVGFIQKQLEEKYKKMKDFPFDADRKMMSSIRKLPEGGFRVYVKGDPARLLERSQQYFDGEKVREITEEDKKTVLDQYEKYGEEALRVLGYAYRDLDKFDPEISMEETEEKLIFLGLAAMMDPPREEVKMAIEAARRSKIRVLMITGDYAVTAKAIAKKIGLIGENEDESELRIITGKDLAEMSDIELLRSLITKNVIFSRTSPDDKLRVVDLLKRASEIVAVTGDGVNDAPALKRADIGVAMGQTGTEVAKESSEIIILDDSFATLVKAIEEGRVIYKNLTKTVVSSITSNGGELVAVLLSMVAGYLYDIPVAILAIQILAIDLIGEMLPLTALTWDPGGKNLMDEVPRNPVDHMVNKKSLINIGWCGFLMGLFGFLNFIFLSYREGFSWSGFTDIDSILYLRGTTLTYVTIVFIQWMNIMSRRTDRTVFTKYIWSNPRLLFSMAISLFFVLNIAYNPYISEFLRTAPLTLIDWSFAVGAAVLYLLIREGWKKAARGKK